MAVSDIQLPEPDVPVAECDRALGVFMRAWDQLEHSLFSLLHKLLDTDVITAQVIFNAGIDLRTTREILTHLGQHRLSTTEQKKLTGFMRRVKDFQTQRNRIVHGQWTMLITMPASPSPKPLKAKSVTWTRQYQPADGTILKKLALRKDQKLAAAYQFSPERLIKCAEYVVKLAREMKTFEEAITLAPARIQQPVEWQ